MADVGPYEISRDLVEGIGVVVTLDNVQSYGALFDYESADEEVTIVIPSATCPVGDLKYMEEYCKIAGYNYQQPATAADTGKPVGGSGKGNVPSTNRSSEPGESSARK